MGEDELSRWPTDLKISNAHLLNKGYLPTEFEASVPMRILVLPVVQG